ncbi:hypothetical protein D3C87_1448890 [compost metagenome]
MAEKSAYELKREQHKQYEQRVNDVLAGKIAKVPFLDSRFPSAKSKVMHEKISFEPANDGA